MNKVKLNPSATIKGLIDQLLGKTNELVTNANEHSATANPELAGTESDLTGLQVGDTKYALPPVVSANPTLAGTETALTGLEIGDTKYAVGGGVDVIQDYELGEAPYTYSEIIDNYINTNKPLIVFSHFGQVSTYFILSYYKTGEKKIIFSSLYTHNYTADGKFLSEFIVLGEDNSWDAIQTGGIPIEANPADQATGTLTKIKIGNTVYSIGS